MLREDSDFIRHVSRTYGESVGADWQRPPLVLFDPHMTAALTEASFTLTDHVESFPGLPWADAVFMFQQVMPTHKLQPNMPINVISRVRPALESWRACRRSSPWLADEYEVGLEKVSAELRKAVMDNTKIKSADVQPIDLMFAVAIDAVGSEYAAHVISWSDTTPPSAAPGCVAGSYWWSHMFFDMRRPWASLDESISRDAIQGAIESMGLDPKRYKELVQHGLGPRIRKLAVQALAYLLHSPEHRVHVKPTVPPEPKKKGKPQRKPWLREDLPRIILLDPSRAATVHGMRHLSPSGRNAPHPHSRRGHWRTLSEERRVWVRQSWIGPLEWKHAGKTYRVMAEREEVATAAKQIQPPPRASSHAEPERLPLRQ